MRIATAPAIVAPSARRTSRGGHQGLQLNPQPLAGPTPPPSGPTTQRATLPATNAVPSRREHLGCALAFGLSGWRFPQPQFAD
jgi:hypothetical protein